jgi:hypothetical protein
MNTSVKLAGTRDKVAVSVHNAVPLLGVQEFVAGNDDHVPPSLMNRVLVGQSDRPVTRVDLSRSVEGRPVDEFLGAAVKGRTPNSSRSKSAAPWKTGSEPVCPVKYREDGQAARGSDPAPGHGTIRADSPKSV